MALLPLVTATVTAPEGCAGVVQTICVSDQLTMAAGLPPKATLPWTVPKLLPEMVSWRPPAGAPLSGATPAMIGLSGSPSAAAGVLP